MDEEPDIIAEMQRLNEEFWYRMANISAIDDKNEWAEALKKHPDLKRRLIAGLDQRPSKALMESLRDAAREAEAIGKK